MIIKMLYPEEKIATDKEVINMANDHYRTWTNNGHAFDDPQEALDYCEDMGIAIFSGKFY